MLKKLDVILVSYLLSILDYGIKDIRSIDIAKEMGSSKSVTHKHLEDLVKLGLISKEKYGTINLTYQGFKAAINLKTQFDNVYPLFSEVLKLDVSEAKRSTILTITLSSLESLKCIKDYLELTYLKK